MSDDWVTANQRYLSAAIAHVRACVEGAAAEEIEAAERARDEALPDDTNPPALDALSHHAGLTAFERSVLVLTAGFDLDSTLAKACGGRPDYGMALATLPGAHWTALSPQSPLRALSLIELDDGPVLTARALSVPERVLHMLVGVPGVDEELEAWFAPAIVEVEPPPSLQGIAERIARHVEGGCLLLQIGGGDALLRREACAVAAHRLERMLFTARAADLPRDAAERSRIARLWGREVVLGGAVALIEFGDLSQAEADPWLALAERLPGLVFVGSDDPLAGLSRVPPRMEIPLPSVEERRHAWTHCVGTGSEDGGLAPVVEQFRLTVSGIRAAAANAEVADGGPTAGNLWEAARLQARPRMGALAQRIEPRATWDDLVLPEAPSRQLRELVTQVRNRTTVVTHWGFGARTGRGLGVSALFAGPSGTGKTLAAEVLANDLELDLFRIDLSQVVSKYIGETEKNLRRIFDAAERGGALLLFDEADALFSKRTEVRDSHDRYANIEVSYLLQRMESYRGLAILTTNLKDSIDSAFLRRIGATVVFPFPDSGMRTRIWERVFPDEMPRGLIEPARLAQLNVSGGNIANIAIGAAYLASEEKSPVDMGHVLRAAKTEYAKLERTLTRSEVNGWA